MESALGPSAVPLSRPRRREREWLRVLSRAARSRRGAIGLALTVAVVLVAFVGPWFAPYSPTAFETSAFASPSADTLLGGDNLGRDVLSRTLDGGRVLLIMAFAATVLGVAVGAAAGIAAAYLRGRWDSGIMRAVDVILSFPQLVFALLLISIIGSHLWLITLAVGFSHAPQTARVMRAATLDVSERNFIRSVELLGVSPWRVMTREILPNLITPLMVEVGLRLTYSIALMSGLSFLGFSESPPAANWGLMLNENRVGLQANPFGVLAPATLIALLTIGTNTFADAITRVAIGVNRQPTEVAAAPVVPVKAA